MMSSGWIIFLAIVAGIGLGSFVIYRKVRAKVEQVSMAAFGTKDCRETEICLCNDAGLCTADCKGFSGIQFRAVPE